MSSKFSLFQVLLSALVVSGFFGCVRADDTDFMQQSFSFQWQSFAVPVPTTTQCDTLNIQWSRGNNVGPNPVAPYYLSIYTSAYVFPFVVAAGSSLNFDFTVPFGPGTLYQICMFDSQGNTGGCQAIYTVIPNTTASSLSCSNNTLTFPLGPLDIETEVSGGGALSQYGWIPQCSDITVTPKNGTGPYTFTIAPTLHPPSNITSSSASSMTWTVDLTWASPFFVGVLDSAGNSWAYGPLHSGQGTDSCMGSGSKGVSAGAVAGAGVGGIIVGLLAGSAAAFFFLRSRRRDQKRTYLGLDVSSPSGSPTTGVYGTAYRPPQVAGRLFGPTSLGRSSSDGTAYHVEPFMMPETGPRSPTHDRQQTSSSDPAGQSKSVYVVHHDGGRAPVTVYHDNGTEVVELPPRYLDGEASMVAVRGGGGGSSIRSPSDSRSEAANSATLTSGDGNSRPPTSDGQLPGFLEPQRKPQATHKKASSSRDQRPPPS